MSDGLSVFRRVAAGRPDSSPEAAVLTQSLAALDALPRHAPDEGAVSAVLARAAEASDLDGLAAVRGALGLGPAQDSPEAALLAQSLQALDTVPAHAPDPERVAAAEAEAGRATFASVLAATGGGALPATPEAEILRQSVEALGTLPRHAPSDDVLGAILARAAEASVEPVLAAYGEAEIGDTPEVALLAQSAQALDALPRYAPSGQAVAAVLSAAAVNSPAAAPAPRRRAADRGARPSAQPRRRTGVWAGFATLAVAVIAAVVFLQLPSQDLATQAEVADAAPPPSLAPAELAAPEPETAPDASGGAPPLVAAVPERQILPRRAPRGPSAEAFVPVAETQVVAAEPVADLALADAASVSATPEWDAGDDVRLLSLRLRQLREQNVGLEWDEPAVAFGATGPAASGMTPEVQAVREGPPAAAARVRATPADTTSRR